MATLMISIHAPSRERPGEEIRLRLQGWISIHAPSRERRSQQQWSVCWHYFNPRSLAGATSAWITSTPNSCISIHAPSRERHEHVFHHLTLGDFNPRSLAGATKADGTPARRCEFQSTLPRGSDDTAKSDLRQACISIHAPSRERRQPAAPIAR